MIIYTAILAGAVVGFVIGYIKGADQQIKGYNEIIAIARGQGDE